MKKGGFLRNVLDTIRSNQANQSSGGPNSSSGNQANGREFGGQLKPQHFSLAQVARHGFPEQPTALAFDPVQKIAAIGTKTGALRVFGRPGVDVWAQHKPECAVTHIKFVINQGAIITVTADESIHLWSLRGPNLRLQHSQNTSPSTSSSPAQASHSPAPQQQQQQTGTTSSSSGTASSSTTATLTNKQSTFDNQPGDPDFLADTLSSGSPTYDKRKQYPRQPEILHTLRFQREHITCLHQTLMSKWLYIGTERGNVHVANVETFELSGYSIAWNKAIELCRKTHPGSIIHISECPQDSNKLLIGYESGCIVLWDLKGRNAEGRYYHAENLLWLSWHYEGKQFVAAHGDGSLVTWQTRSNARPLNILYPHAKTPTQSGNEPGEMLNFQQQSSSFVARALSNELYRPINKVDWKTSKNNEQFLLFSGGLPYDGLDGLSSNATSTMQQQQSARAASVQPPSSGQQSAQQYLKASSASHNPSPISPSISPAMNSQAAGSNDPAASKISGSSRQSQQQQQQQQQQTAMKERKSLRSTSLTVMYGKSITVLEMDDTIIDFITICDNSPYENDTSDPQAVIILLSNDLILIDLTSSGYPSFDSPYPSANLNESPVTCLQYLADCSSDLIPFLYSTSQNAVSRVPKKGFSDKEWPINGGEWGQQMQSYPELVITGHADGTIKFWDMSGVNFDLISKIKTSKFFERPNKLRNSTIITHNQALSKNSAAAAAAASKALSRPPLIGNSAITAGAATIDQSMATLNMSEREETAASESSQSPLEESPFAIERIEYYPSSKHLVIAGALSQVIQFRINKKESQAAGYPVSGSSAGQSSSAQEIATILVDPPTHSDSINQPQQHQKHLILKARNPLAAGSSSSSGGSSSSSSGSNRARSNGFQAELICLTPSYLVPIINCGDVSVVDPVATTGSPSLSSSPAQPVARQLSSYHCVAPPRVTALALQAAHNILAYAHENGIVLVDIIQKCVIISASLNDLYGGTSMMQSNRDISIQPFATSSILQHHYQSTLGSPGDFSTTGSGFTSATTTNNNGSDNGPSRGNETDHQLQRTKTRTDNENGGIADNNGTFQKSASGGGVGRSNETSTSAAATNQLPPQLPKSRFTANSAFQRQLSTTALLSEQSSGVAASGDRISGGGSKVAASGGQTPRLFQRQMTASQLFNHSSQSPNSSAAATEALTNKQRAAALLASARANNPELASSTSCLSSSLTTATMSTTTSSSSFMSRPSTAASSGSGADSSGQKKAGGKKRIISRMLSISAIHTPASLSGLTSANQSGEQSSASSAAAAAVAATTGTNYTSTGSGSLNGSVAVMTSAGDQQPDKIDSSFTRSRSSSTSSSAANVAQNAATAQTGGSDGSQQLGESVQCLCFLDWSQAMAAAASSSTLSSSSSTAVPIGGGGGVGATSTGSGSNNNGAASSPPNNKSLGSPPIADHSNLAAAAAAAGQLALWLGTSQGSVLLVHLQMPDNEDNRVLQLQSVNAEPIPQASIKLPGAILCLAPFTSELQSVAPTGGSNAATGGQNSPAGPQSVSSMSMDLVDSPTAGAGGSSSGNASGLGGGGGGGQSSSANVQQPSNCSPNSSFDSRSSLFLAIVSEKQAKIYQIPSQLKANQQQQQQHSKHHSQSGGQQQKHHPATSAAGATANLVADSPLGKLLTNKTNCISKMDICDSSYACRSQLVQMRSPDETCLVSYLATGSLIVHSLPQLRLLHEADFVPYSNQRIASSMLFSRNGHCLYQPSGGEISKFTLSSQYRALVNEMTGLLYVPRDMPDMPRPNFFKSLFTSVASGGSSAASKQQSDRDELFGEKASRGVAKHFSTSSSGGPSSMDKLRSAAVGTMGHDMRVAREGLDERGERLGEIEDKTLQMMNQSESYAQAAHQLAQKFKDKKWYQF